MAHAMERADTCDAAMKLDAIRHQDSLHGAQRKLTRAVAAAVFQQRVQQNARMQSVTDTGCIHLVAGFTLANRFFTGLLYQSSVSTWRIMLSCTYAVRQLVYRLQHTTSSQRLYSVCYRHTWA